ncbi:hypothetical protein PHYPSEUDO_009321 [Phytophthora pseudosyringae]|uniref:Uncharacterized protein n=1 Tax=Phytophthora pseudosyringae TaxID=221518 RepID=A0A8T1VFF5_9STRA|nr:hypothetical protein PHYPSEUDO_009321 [Phytophthora pseudosyringae]
MSEGPNALQNFLPMSSRPYPAAAGSALPQVDNATVTGEITSNSELSTALNTIKRSMAKFAWSKRVVHKNNIKNASGVVKPGNTTLLLGQTGSGRTPKTAVNLADPLSQHTSDRVEVAARRASRSWTNRRVVWMLTLMDGVRKVADSGRTIVCTIHQPSSDVFFLFDHLLLLKRGGESVFVGELGERCHKLVDYLEEFRAISYPHVVVNLSLEAHAAISWLNLPWR